MIGLDLAKNVFQVHGVTVGGVVVRRPPKRSQVHRFFANLEPCLVGMEACGGTHYWARELNGLRHTVRVMAPIFVKPYLKTNTNDRNDAEAICEAVNSRNPSRPWGTAEDKALHTENVCEWRHGVSGTSSQKSASAIQN